MRRLAIFALALGTVGGYGSSLAHFLHGRHERRARFEHHVAQVCADAALASAAHAARAPGPGALGPSAPPWAFAPPR